MSWALVNRSLELFDGDAPGSSKEARKSGPPSTARHGPTRARKLKQRQQQKKTQANQHLIQKQVASAVEAYKRAANQDHTQDTLRLLKAIDTRRPNDKYIQQVKQHHHKELDKRSGRAQPNDTKEEESVFTEEDFKNFEEELATLDC